MLWHARAFEHGTKQVSMFSVGIPFILVSIAVVSVRIHVVLHLLSKNLAIDDYFMVIGTFFTICLSVANMICGWYGVGMHTLDIPPENLVPMLKANLATRLLYVVAICFVKLSILLFYLNIERRRAWRWTGYFLMAFVLALSLATFFVLLFVCVPPSLFWNPVEQALHPEKCMKQSTQQAFFELNGVLNIVQDVSIIIFPIGMIWNLKMSIRRKIGLAALFSVGLVAVAAGSVRFYYVLSLAKEADLWYYMADSLNWCSIEIYAGIIASSAATFNKLVKEYLPKKWSGSYGSSATPRHNYQSAEQIKMRSHGTHSSRKHGIIGLTENDSEEAIVSKGGR
ncbi:hypothetical protein P280DRAFT_468190 [Massarina eburnea CBS 473.64]|uniref:Rhodopsin domain-containing protein n=1 Tax=Massarina eburnea CBS 473.64 TaxID=1395130 RepID=A0A6A6S581_9PLEO|nr:hypothetical protein P280DRAFT_468190 [Massarina eburnea CBS 473.64]